MEDVTRHGIALQLRTGDITSQPDVDAIVNAANAQLKTGGGVAGAIHRAAGPGLAEEAEPMAPIEPGEAVVTGGHDLPNDYVVHCLGPRYGKDQPEDELLAACYDHALDRAEEEGIRSIAFPALSTGAFGYPLDEATGIASDTVLERTDSLDTVETIRFVLFSADDYEAYERALADRTR